MFMPKLSGKEIMEMGYINTGIQLSMSLFRNHAATETVIIYILRIRTTITFKKSIAVNETD